MNRLREQTLNEPATMTEQKTAAASAATTTRRLLRLRGYAHPPSASAAGPNLPGENLFGNVRDLTESTKHTLDAGAEAWQKLTPKLLRSVCAYRYLTHEIQA